MTTTTDYKAGRREVTNWLNGHGIRLANVEDLGIQRDADGWDHYAWSMTVKNSVVRYTFPYHQGMAHTERPDLVDIMAALLFDAACVTGTFEDFCGDLGYDPDSRKAEKLFRTIGANNAKLAKLFRTTDLQAILDAYEPLREAAGL